MTIRYAFYGALADIRDLIYEGKIISNITNYIFTAEQWWEVRDLTQELVLSALAFPLTAQFPIAHATEA